MIPLPPTGRESIMEAAVRLEELTEVLQRVQREALSSTTSAEIAFTQDALVQAAIHLTRAILHEKTLLEALERRIRATTEDG